LKNINPKKMILLVLRGTDIEWNALRAPFEWVLIEGIRSFLERAWPITTTSPQHHHAHELSKSKTP
jgi:hypothetical protein